MLKKENVLFNTFSFFVLIIFAIYDQTYKFLTIFMRERFFF